MQAVVLCGGLGTRLREETEYRPKPMVEVGGRPILWHIMRTYAKADIRDFILCLGYKGWMIKEYFLNYRSAVSDITIETGATGAVTFHPPDEGIEDWRITCAETGIETQTGGRVRRALKYVTSPTFCLTYGDGVSDVDIRELLRFHAAHGRIGTLTAVRPSGRFGELRVDPDGRVGEFREKPDDGRGYINGGFFVFDTARFAEYLDARDSLVLEREPLTRLAEDGELVAYHHDGFWQCMDTYREWKILNDLWTSGQAPWSS